jgi:hypothetical protein
MPTRTLLAVALGALLYGGLASTASAGIIYSNVTNFTGFGVTDGGAANVAGDNITTLLADDTHQVAGFAGQSKPQVSYVARLYAAHDGVVS